MKSVLNNLSFVSCCCFVVGPVAVCQSAASAGLSRRMAAAHSQSFLPQYFIYEDKTRGKHLDFNVHHFARMNSLCRVTTIVQQHGVWEAVNIGVHFVGFLMTSFSLPLFYFHSNLLSNPYVCDCHLAWLGQWLKKTRVVSGNPRCQKPAFLKEIPIQDVATPDFTCDGELPLSLCTYSAICLSFSE